MLCKSALQEVSFVRITLAVAWRQTGERRDLFFLTQQLGQLLDEDAATSLQGLWLYLVVLLLTNLMM